MDDTPVTSLSEFVNAVNNVLTKWGDFSDHTHAWFRGQANASWRLQPRMYRIGENAALERNMVRDFKLRANAFFESARSDMDLMFIMQHHGMPTRLLDWTESHLTSLFFAVETEQVDSDGAVWILRPSELNAFTHSTVGNRVPMSDHPLFAEFTLDLDAEGEACRVIAAKLPMSVRPGRGTERIVAQRGMFTVHGEDPRGLEEHHASSNFGLHRILIDGRAKPRLKKELLLAGVSYSSVFPDLDGLSKEISYRYSQHYMATEFPKTS